MNGRYRNRNAPKLGKNNTNIYNASVVIIQTDDIWGAGRRRFENLAMPIRLVTGLGLPLEYQKCFSKIMIAASKNYMGPNANTGKI
jgi:hypothetical protein